MLKINFPKVCKLSSSRYGKSAQFLFEICLKRRSFDFNSMIVLGLSFSFLASIWRLLAMMRKVWWVNHPFTYMKKLKLVFTHVHHIAPHCVYTHMYTTLHTLKCIKYSALQGVTQNREAWLGRPLLKLLLSTFLLFPLCVRVQDESDLWLFFASLLCHKLHQVVLCVVFNHRDL